jgi:hypothetical protein
MSVGLQSLASELLAMAAEDLRIREELARSGALFEGCHPRMREIHERNAKRLGEVMDAHGWPGRSRKAEFGVAKARATLRHTVRLGSRWFDEPSPD